MAIQKADPHLRRTFLVLFVAMAIFGLVALEWGVPLLLAAIAEREPILSLRLLQLALILMFAPLIPMTFYTYWLAMRIKRSQQFPHPGMKVIRDTQILRGNLAQQRGNQLLVVSFGLGIIAVIGLIYLPYLMAQIGISLLSPQETSRGLSVYLR